MSHSADKNKSMDESPRRMFSYKGVENQGRPERQTGEEKESGMYITVEQRVKMEGNLKEELIVKIKFIVILNQS